jgi:hypothetical protein
MQPPQARRVWLVLLIGLIAVSGGAWFWCNNQKAPSLVPLEKYVSREGRSVVQRGSAAGRDDYLVVKLDGKLLQLTLLPQPTDKIVKVVTIPTEGLPEDQKLPVAILIRTVKNEAKMMAIDKQRVAVVPIGHFKGERLVYSREAQEVVGNLLQ